MRRLIGVVGVGDQSDKPEPLYPVRERRAGDKFETTISQEFSSALFAAGMAAGFTKDNIYKAKQGPLADKVKASNKGRFHGTWHWGQGHPANWKLRPEPADLGAGASPHNTHKSHNSPNSGGGEEEATTLRPPDLGAGTQQHKSHKTHKSHNSAGEEEEEL
jgi:hypothetical protein